MKKTFLAIAIAAGVAASATANAEIKTKWFGFAQITGEQQKQNSPNDGVVFGADRIRFGFKLKDGNVFGKLQADLNKTDSGPKQAVLPEIIKDAVVGYKVSNAAKISLGQFKTPVGMDFNTSGKKLDITKRGMEKKLVLERAAGAMISGRKIANGFGYDVFLGNPAGRSSAYSGSAVVGKDNSMAVRVSYDMGKMVHMELSNGKTEDSTMKDYTVTDFAVRMKTGSMTAKLEYITGSNVKGVDGADESVWYLHYGQKLSDKVELVARYYSASDDASNTDMTNTYLGANFFLGSNATNGRVQVNYVLTGGDDNGVYGGVAKGYQDSAILTQYQVSF